MAISMFRRVKVLNCMSTSEYEKCSVIATRAGISRYEVSWAIMPQLMSRNLVEVQHKKGTNGHPIPMYRKRQA